MTYRFRIDCLYMFNRVAWKTGRNLVTSLENIHILEGIVSFLFSLYVSNEVCWKMDPWNRMNLVSVTCLL
jgi:hypothetical protein